MKSTSVLGNSMLKKNMKKMRCELAIDFFFFGSALKKKYNSYHRVDTRNSTRNQKERQKIACSPLLCVHIIEKKFETLCICHNRTRWRLSKNFCVEHFPFHEFFLLFSFRFVEETSWGGKKKVANFLQFHHLIFYEETKKKAREKNKFNFFLVNLQTLFKRQLSFEKIAFASQPKRTSWRKVEQSKKSTFMLPINFSWGWEISVTRLYDKSSL